ncbi:MAG: hypothetical protein R6V50_07420 [Thermoplasmatota archaeon]
MHIKRDTSELRDEFDKIFNSGKNVIAQTVEETFLLMRKFVCIA